MSDIISWFTANWSTIVDVLGALLAAASVITALTPTPADDSIVSWLRKVLGYLSVLTYSDAPGTLSAPLVQAGDRPLMIQRTRR